MDTDTVMAIPAEIQALARARGDRLREVLAHDKNQPLLGFGQLWIASTPEQTATMDNEPRVIVVLDPSVEAVRQEQSMLAVPLSLELAYQTELDLRVTAEESPLGYTFMVEVWNEITMLASQRARYLGILEPKQQEHLRALYRVHLGLEEDMSSELEAVVGSALLHEEDPRVDFQEREIAACDYLREPLMQRVWAEEPAKVKETTTTRKQVPGIVEGLREALGRLAGLLVPVPRMVTGLAPALGGLETQGRVAEHLVLPEGESPYALGSLAVKLPDGQPGRADLWLETPQPGTGNLLVRIVNAENVPVAGVQVVVGLGLWRQPGEDLTDADGRTQIPKVPLSLMLQKKDEEISLQLRWPPY